MRKLDRYIIQEMLGPFLFGMGAFAIVLVGVDLMYHALRLILEEGLEARWARHRRNHEFLLAGLAEMGLDVYPDHSCALWSLNTVRIPEGVDDTRVRRALLNEFNIEIGGGLGPVVGKIWRIGLMGHSATKNNVMLVLSALQSLLEREGFSCAGDGALAAARALEG